MWSRLDPPLDLSVWIDRARVIRRDHGPRIEGETQIVETTGPWFKCRLPPNESVESRQEDKNELTDRRQLTAKLTDLTGEKVILREQDRLEIESGPGPDYTPEGIWEVLSVMTPRNGVGAYLLLVATVVRRTEW
jgi:hypothetical protein